MHHHSPLLFKILRQGDTCLQYKDLGSREKRVVGSRPALATSGKSSTLGWRKKNKIQKSTESSGNSRYKDV